MLLYNSIQRMSTKKYGKRTKIEYNNIKRRKQDGNLQPINISQYMYTNAKVSINELNKRATQFSKEMKQKKFNGTIQIEIYTPQGPRTGYATTLGQPTNIYDPRNYDSDLIGEDGYSNIEEWYNEGNAIITKYCLFLIEKPTSGGNDDKNDCLHKAIVKAYNGVLPKNKEGFVIFAQPQMLKSFLGIKRDALVNSSDHIFNIEYELRRPINISGDVIRLSKMSGRNPINLILHDGHYELETNINSKVENIFTEKTFIIYKYDEDTKLYDCYDGSHFTLTALEMYRKKKNNKHHWLHCFPKYTLEEHYIEYNEQAKLLKEASFGKINLYQTGTFVKTALSFFYKTTQCMNPPDAIDAIEADWLLKCNRSGHTYSEKDYNGPGFKYDFCSKYPSIMNSSITLPVKKGEFKTITNADITDYCRYGIYRAIVSNYDLKLFKPNAENFYTHYDLTTAKKHGYQIDMIDDEQPNFLYYSKECNVIASHLFRPFTTQLYTLKTKKIMYAKRILNILWGALAQRKIKKNIVEPKTEFILEFDDDITSIKNCRTGNIKIESVSANDSFMTNFARFAPFITSRGKQLITDIIAIDKNNIVHCVTDGIISKTKLELVTGNIIGDLKYEGYCPNINIKHLYAVSGEFSITV